MSEKPWIDTEIPTPTLLSRTSSLIDVNVTRNSYEIKSKKVNVPNINDYVEKFQEEEELPVTSKEFKGWYIYSAATEAYYIVAITLFIPIILENRANEAGFQLDLITPCNTVTKVYKCVTRYGLGYIDPERYPLYTITISVFVQCLVYILFGSLADLGENRKRLLFVFSYIGAISTVVFLLVFGPNLYWLAGFLTIISNVCFGASYVFYQAYIPTFTRTHPLVIEANKLGKSKQEVSKIEDKVTNSFSSHSIAIGYASGALLLILAAIITYFMKQATYSYQIGTALTGVWWSILLIFPLLWLEKRKSISLPKGGNYFSYWIDKAFCSTKKLTQSKKFLFSWFLLSGGFNAIASIVITIGKKELLMSNTLLTCTAIVVPICASIGVYAFLFIQRKLNLSTKSMILITGTFFSLIPIYGLLRFISNVGFKSEKEIFIFSAYFGFMLGAIQSYSRVLFAKMIPKGHENEFFGRYEIVVKSSSWVGPLIIGLIDNFAFEQKCYFWFLLSLMMVALILMNTVNVEDGKNEAELYYENELLEILENKKTENSLK